jgi:hypothetical protein
LNSVSVASPALPSSTRLTSKSVSASWRALTLTWIEMFGPFSCGPNERGAFGFSKEKSFMYCASELSAGPWVGVEPLPGVSAI